MILPHILDQYYWAHPVAVPGLGPRAVPVHGVTQQALTGLGKSAVNGVAFRERASRLVPAIAARNGVDAAVDQLDRSPGGRTDVRLDCDA